MNFEKNSYCPRCFGSGLVKTVDHSLLRKARKEANVSLRQMAEELNISAPYLSDIELGKRACPDFVKEAYEKLKPTKKKAS